jgi:LL-diaminopimelate aminotransferase
MIRTNNNFNFLKGSYLFSEVARRVNEYKEKNPDVEIIRMDIGDVTLPLCKAAVDGIKRGAEEMSNKETFHGYGPERGYEFLRKCISETDYIARGINISSDEVFISDGAKSDIGNFVDMLPSNARIAITNPVYPVYVDANIMAGRLPEDEATDIENKGKIIFLDCTEETGFLPKLPTEPVDVVYLCYPNNPTGVVMNRDELTKWVDYARDNSVLLLFDSAYEAYIRDENIPRSIFEIDGAKEVAVEFRSFSKTAGFTGVRCGYTVVPFDLKVVSDNGKQFLLNNLWNRRQSTKFNGASFVVQRAAEALYTAEGRSQVTEMTNYYIENATLLYNKLTEAGMKVFGGKNSPYVWIKTPSNISSWEFFSLLLEKAHVTSTPGVGFGSTGEGFVRLT